MIISHGIPKLADIKDAPTIIIANELLDVLPFRQYVKVDGKWQERCIGLDGNDKLTWAIGSGILDPSNLPENSDQEPDGAIYEISPAREALIAQIADLLKANTGMALFIDYGHSASGFGDTFQALRKHKFTDPLLSPGFCDLTNHIDFEALAKIVQNSGLKVQPISTQGEFLLKLGLLERAASLGHNQLPDVQARLTSEAERSGPAGHNG